MDRYIKADSAENGYLTDLRHNIHRHPCLSANEKEAAQIVCEVLSSCNPDNLWTGIGGHGIIAEFKGKASAPSLLFRCELDALPIKESVQRPYMSVYDGIAHCCGHDGHMAIMCGLARWISRNREMLSEGGSIYLLFQPEEETGAGAEKMARWMKENGLCFDYASWEASNPTDAIIETIKTVNSFNEQTSFSTVVGAGIGDTDYGITPGKGFVAVTTRSQTDDGLACLKDKILSSARAIAQNHGLRLDVSETDYFPATINTPNPTELIREIAHEAGYTLEENNVGTKGSDDFVHIAKMARKGATFFDLGCGREHAPLHRPDFDFDDSLIPVGLDLICRVCLHILQSR